jgi:hypothetical protein
VKTFVRRRARRSAKAYIRQHVNAISATSRQCDRDLCSVAVRTRLLRLRRH